MKNKNFRLTIAACGLALPALELPYYVNALRLSPLDRWSWIFMVVALPMMAAAAVRVPKEKIGFAPAALPAAALFLIAFVFTVLVNPIHAAAIIFGFGFAWSAAYFAFGWPAGYLLAPAYAMLALGSTSIRYRLEAATGIDGLLAQAAIAALLIVWQAAALRMKSRPKAADVIFFAVAAAVIAGAFMSGRLRTREELAPDFSECVFGDYVGLASAATESDHNFFGKSRVERYRFPEDRLLPDGRVAAIEVLKVGDFDDVHKIHPAGHCLTTSGYKILSETIRPETISGTAVDINEIVVADANAMRSLVWVWYSTPKRSSGNFDALRYGYDPDAGWSEYLLMTPLSDGDPDQARTVLRSFLTAVLTANRQNQ